MNTTLIPNTDVWFLAYAEIRQTTKPKTTAASMVHKTPNIAIPTTVVTIPVPSNVAKQRAGALKPTIFPVAIKAPIKYPLKYKAVKMTAVEQTDNSFAVTISRRPLNEQSTILFIAVFISCVKTGAITNANVIKSKNTTLEMSNALAKLFQNCV